MLKDRVALITGAGSGIGESAALALAREGARIGALGHTPEDIEKVVRRIQEQGGEAIALEADISDPERMRQVTEELVRRFGRLDIVFANAGINGVWAPIEDLKVDEWKQTLDVNLTGTFLTIKYAVPHLKKQSRPSIIVTASVNGTRMFSNIGATAYATSKAGQVALTKMLALELARFKIRVNVICPGWIATDIEENTEKRNPEEIKKPAEYPEGAVPLTRGGPGHPDQVAQLVLFLASDASSHISGTEVWIDGAQSLLEG